MGRTVTMTAADVRARAAAAREFHQVAKERVEIAPQGPSSEAQVAASNAVHAAIAAADALCGHAHGFHASGQDHREAVRLVRALADGGPALARRLTRLLNAKTAFTYGGFCTRAEATRASDDAAALIEALDRLSL